MNLAIWLTKSILNNKLRLKTLLDEESNLFLGHKGVFSKN